MSLAYEQARAALRGTRRRWLVTGVAGFIGSNLAETLLGLGQEVVGLDNFATGHPRNLSDICTRAGEAAADFHFVEGDIRDFEACRSVCEGVDVVLHQAALGSVPRSILDPTTSHDVNVTGTVNVLLAARDAGVRRIVYASSSSVYGNHMALPKVEEHVGTPLSPYAVTKRAGEMYATTFAQHYGIEAVGLRYFNVFGRRQDPDGPYAAVIPRWVGRLLQGQACEIYGDGETSRDFCYIENVVQANVLAALAPSGVAGEVFNVAAGKRTTLAELFSMIRAGLAPYEPAIAEATPQYLPFRPGDVRHSLADTSKAEQRLGYAPTHDVRAGLAETLTWYAEQARIPGTPRAS